MADQDRRQTEGDAIVTYIDHREPRSTPGVHGFEGVVTHSWTDDARARLTWLYGSPDARIEASRPDVARWNALGLAVAA